MTTQILIIFLLVNSIHYTMQPGEIFERLGFWFDAHLPEKLKPPVYSCPICQMPWYGSIIYWVIPWEHSLIWWPIVVISAMGLQVVLHAIKPKK